MHTHSNISDGELAPEMLIKEAANRGLTAIALTDHDTINGLESAKNAVKSLENNESFRFIPGIEVNINWTRKSVYGIPGLGLGGEFHLLGLGIHSPSVDFLSAVDKLFRRREIRNNEMLDRMFELSLISPGLSVKEWENGGREDVKKELTALSGGHSLGRPHFAAFLTRHRIVKDVKAAFARYLSVGKPLYVPKEGLYFDEAAVIIRNSGGIPVLAHPASLYMSWGRLPVLIKKLKEMGLMGIEAWHPIAKNSSSRRFEALGKSLGLYITEGSDFHGKFSPDRALGYSGKNRKISEDVLEAIPELNR